MGCKDTSIAKECFRPLEKVRVAKPIQNHRDQYFSGQTVRANEFLLMGFPLSRFLLCFLCCKHSAFPSIWGVSPQGLLTRLVVLPTQTFIVLQLMSHV